jgi:hypothetical protein
MSKGTVFEFGESRGDWFKFFDSEVDLQSGEIMYSEPRADAGEICIRSVSPFWREKVEGRKKESEFVFNPKTRAMEKVSYTVELTPEEEAKERDDSYDYCITGFRNLFDGEGNEILCTRENKMKLMSVPRFERFILKCLEIQINTANSEKEDAEKN